MLTPLHNKLNTACQNSNVMEPIGAGLLGKRKTSEVFHRYEKFGTVYKLILDTTIHL